MPLPDEIDFFIVSEITNNTKNGCWSDTWEMAQKYAMINKIKNAENVHRTFQYRIKNNYIKRGYFKTRKNGSGKTEFQLNEDYLLFRKYKFGKGFEVAWIMRI